MATRLSLSAIGRGFSGVAAPRYRRADLSAGIVHFGVGNFHRAHQAAYLDRLFEAGRSRDWAIVGAGVMPGDARLRAALEGQDWLSTLVEQSAAANAARVTGAMIDYLPVGDARAIVARLSDPAIRIVSLTVTEGGYFIDSASGGFDAAHPGLKPGADGALPVTVFGMIIDGLEARRAAGLAPFTVMSCDNLPGNGAVTRNTIAGIAELRDPALARWIRDEVAFPNGMVDRITPTTTDSQRDYLRDHHGLEDHAPVFCEDFTQWVLEDHFPNGRPALEQVGVEFVADVEPFEHAKIRVLNGGHALIAYPSALLGVELAHEAMAHPLISAFMEKVQRTEILPILPPPPGVDLAAYRDKVAERFSNPKIRDSIRRLCFDGSNRQPKFIVPSVADQLACGGPIAGLALASALWRRYCEGVDAQGNAIEPNDPSWASLQAAAQASRSDPDRWLAQEQIYGPVGKAQAFRDRFAAAVRTIEREGVEAALQGYLNAPA